MTITAFDKKNIEIFRAKFTKLVREAELGGLTFEIGRITYSSTSVKFKVTANTVGQATVAVAHAQADLNMGMRLHGLTKTIGNDGYTLVAYHHRKHKFPFIVTVAGRPGQFKLSPLAAKARFA